MASFNQVILLGNLTRDPEMRYLPNNTPVVGFGMACNRRFKDGQGQDREEVMFIDCSAFGKQAEIINQYCRKGNLLFVEGRLRLETWEDKQGGGKRSKHSVHIDNFQLMPRRDGGPGGGGDFSPEGDQSAPAPRRAPMGQRPAQRPAPQAPQQDQPPFDDQQQFKEDDIPF
jgi:single-strand DNA-binding protein